MSCRKSELSELSEVGGLTSHLLSLQSDGFTGSVGVG